MAIFVGSNEINDIMIGTTQINEVYVGSTQVWVRDTGGGGGGGGGTCFLGNSLVTLNDLTTKRISEIIAGDLVLGDGGVVNEVITLRTTNANSEVMFSINHLKTTSSHPIKTTEGWKAIDPANAVLIHPELSISELVLGDTLIRVDASGNEYQEEVTSITSEAVTDTLYNLNVSGSDTPDIAGNDTYIVDGVVVHNK